MANPKYKVIPVWRNNMLKLVGQGHPVKAVCHTLHVGYDRLLMEKRRDPNFAEQLDNAEVAGREKPARRFFV